MNGNKKGLLGYAIYMLLMSIVSIFLLLYEAYTSLWHRRSSRWNRLFLATIPDKPILLVHAASAGEVLAVEPLLHQLEEKYPQYALVISTGTKTGYALVQRFFPHLSVVYFPWDIPLVTKAWLRHISPRLIVMVETELWPYFLRTAACLQIPVVMVNGRISKKTFGFLRHFPSFVRYILSSIQLFLMQSEHAAVYIKQLGAYEERIHITGNMKYDQTYGQVSPTYKKSLQQQLGITDKHYPIWVVGSTHIGEHEHICNAFQQVRQAFPQAKLIYVPRYINEVEKIIEMGRTWHIDFVKRSEGKPLVTDSPIIVDTMGELGQLYSLADVVFVGGSLTPVGGHNVLEPASHGKPIIVGPHMEHFADVFASFQEQHAIITVANAKELAAACMYLAKHKQVAMDIGKTGLQIVQANQGATEKTIRIIADLMRKEL